MYKMIFRNPNNYQCITGGELYHHGILGQKWGIRRFQKKDGSLTAAGRRRYYYDEAAFDELAMEQAKKDGLDEGDNYKVYKEAMMGNKKAKAIIKQWKAEKEENDYMDFFESEDAEKAREKAYQDTIEYLKKVDPDYLEAIIANNNNEMTDLDAYHDFRKCLDAFEDEQWDAAFEIWKDKKYNS